MGGIMRMKGSTGWVAAASSLLFFGAVAGAADPPPPFVLLDTEFVEGDWSAQPFFNNGGVVTQQRSVTGGNPDAYRFMTHDLPPLSSLSVFHRYEAGSYDPSTQGAIGGISVSFDDIELQPPFVGAAVGQLLVVWQGDAYFYAKQDLTYTTTDWRTRRLFCLKPADFAPYGDELPDFSAAGAPMRFGVIRSNTNNSTTTSYTTQHGLDNFRVAVHGADNPGCDGEPADLRVYKTDGRHRWSLDPVVAYTITVANVGGSASTARIYETVPWNSKFRAAQSTPGWQCGSPDGGSTCILDLEALTPGASVEVTFAVKVANAIPVYWGLFNEVLALGAGGISATEVTSPGPCDLGDPLSANICDMLCAMYPLVCAALAPPPAAAPAPNAAAEADDDVFDIPMLYRLRDRVMQATRGGARATQLYYQFTADMARAAASEPSLLDLARAVLSVWEDDLRALVAGRGDEAVVDEEEIAALNVFLDSLRDAASADLAAAIDRERARLALGQWIGVDLDEVLSRLSFLTCEGYEEKLFCGELTGDCAVSASDALRALKMAVGQLDEQGEADMDHSGAVTAGDALRILKQAVGAVPPTDACN